VCVVDATENASCVEPFQLRGRLLIDDRGAEQHDPAPVPGFANSDGEVAREDDRLMRATNREARLPRVMLRAEPCWPRICLPASISRVLFPTTSVSPVST
jgi:hypothetical protein